MSTIHVTNIHPSLQADSLTEIFQLFGTIQHFQLRADTTSHNGSQAAIISYVDGGAAAAALQFNGTDMVDRPVQVSLASNFTSSATTPSSPQHTYSAPSAMMATSATSAASAASVSTPVYASAEATKRADEVARSLYIGNLHPNVNEMHLHQLFSTVGTVLYIKIAGDELATVRYAFMEFAEAEAIPKALTLNGTILVDRPIKTGKSSSPIQKIGGMAFSAASGNRALAMQTVRLLQAKLNEDKKPLLEKYKEEEQERERRRQRDREEREREREERRHR